jgi:hypothetical protein
MSESILYYAKAAFQKPHRVPPYIYNNFINILNRRRFKKNEQLVVEQFQSEGWDSEVNKSLFRHSDFRFDELNQYAEEIHQSQLLSQAHLNLAEKRTLQWGPPSRCWGLYALARHYNPEILIETGVFDGLSTVYLLEALRQNESGGTLYSIDSPAPNLPPNKDPGWIIPNKLRSNWDLTLGESQNKLEPLLNKVGSPDFFYHDSWHTYPLMSYEFQTVTDCMDSGVICGHDINRNHAFLELCSSVNSSVNVDSPFKIGRMGVFGYVLVGDLSDDIPTKYPDWQY